MIEDVVIRQSTDTPEVIMSIKTNKLIFKGVCMPENPNLFFTPIIQWVKNYLESGTNDTLIEFELEYINSMTIKYLFNILSMFKEKQRTTQVNWKYKKNDLLMIEKGIEFEYITKLNINMIEI